MGRVGRVVTRDLKGMARSCLSHTSLCVIGHLYGEWVGTVYLSLLACVWGGDGFRLVKVILLCSVKVNKKILLQHHLRG